MGGGGGWAAVARDRSHENAGSRSTTTSSVPTTSPATAFATGPTSTSVGS